MTPVAGKNLYNPKTSEQIYQTENKMNFDIPK